MSDRSLILIVAGWVIGVGAGLMVDYLVLSKLGVL